MQVAKHHFHPWEPEDQLAEVTPLPQFLEEAEHLITEMETDDGKQVASKKDLRLLRNKTDRARTVTIAVVALIAIGALILGYFNSGSLAATRAETAINTGSAKALTQAIDELRASGVPENQLPVAPVIDPAEPVDVDGLINATVATVLAKIRTDPAYRGATGLAGANGADGMSPECLTDISRCVGATGPQGIQGVQGIPGVQGPIGPQGAQGDPGPAGADGSVCPDGSARQTLQVVTEENPIGPDSTATIRACVVT